MSDFTMTPDYPIDEIPMFKTLVTEFENNVEQRRNKVSATRRRWNWNFTNRSASDFSTFVSFFITKKGAYSSFTWTNPNDSTEYTVRFFDDEVPISRIRYGRYNWNCVVIQVI